MTPVEFERLLDAFNGNAEHDLALIRAHPVSAIYQLEQLLDECDTESEAHAVVTANAALAEQLVDMTDAYRRMLDAGKSERPEIERLLLAVRSAPDSATAEALLASAEPADYATVAATLALDRMSADDLNKVYLELVSVGKLEAAA